MKKYILVFLSLSFGFYILFANNLNPQRFSPTNKISLEKEKNINAFFYTDTGFSAFLLYPVPLPFIEIGFRSHQKCGYDISMTAYPYLSINAFSINSSFLYFFKKNFYGGIGASFSNWNTFLSAAKLLDTSCFLHFIHFQVWNIFLTSPNLLTSILDQL